MAEKDDLIRKIKKIMALAEDTSASDKKYNLLYIVQINYAFKE